MTALNSPHDRFFKAVFGRTEVAAEFLERYLPTTAAQALNWKTLRTAKDSFLDPELALHPATCCTRLIFATAAPAMCTCCSNTRAMSSRESAWTSCVIGCGSGNNG
jgi:hypothetical protein